MDFEKFKITQIDGQETYGGLKLSDIVNMGYENFHYYLAKKQKRKLDPEQTKTKYKSYMGVANDNN